MPPLGHACSDPSKGTPPAAGGTLREVGSKLIAACAFELYAPACPPSPASKLSMLLMACIFTASVMAAEYAPAPAPTPAFNMYSASNNRHRHIDTYNYVICTPSGYKMACSVVCETARTIRGADMREASRRVMLLQWLRKSELRWEVHHCLLLLLLLLLLFCRRWV